MILLAGLGSGIPAAGWAACSDEAQSYYNRGVQIDRSHIEQRQPCEAACLNEKRYFYQRAVDLCPTFAEAHNNLGDVYEKLGQYEDALRHYQRAIELNP